MATYTDRQDKPHPHRTPDDIVGYRVVETRTDAGYGTVVVEFFDGRFYPNAIDVAHQISSDTRRGFAAVDRHYACGCWSTARKPGEISIEETT